MSPLEQLRAEQHDDLALPSDHAFTAFLAETPAVRAVRDREPTTAIERLHLTRARSAA